MFQVWNCRPILRPHFWAFEPTFEDLGSTYDVHLGLIRKRVVDFLLVLTELFRQVLRLRRYERLSLIGFRSAGAGWPKISDRNIEGVASHQLFFFWENYSRQHDHLYYDVKIWRFVSVLSQCTRLTDRILITRPRLHFNSGSVGFGKIW